MALPNPEAKAPTEPVDLGSPGEVSFHSEVQMPDGFTIQILAEARMHTEFADYRSGYSFAGGILNTDRTLKTSIGKLPVAAWPDYQKLGRAAASDHNQFIQLTQTAGKSTAVHIQNDPKAEELILQAFQFIGRHDLDAAKSSLDEAEKLNPMQRHLWSARAVLSFERATDPARLQTGKKDVTLHPEDVEAWGAYCGMQYQFGTVDDTTGCYKDALKNLPGNLILSRYYANLLISRKQYPEAIAVARLALTSSKDDPALRSALLNGLLLGGQKEEGVTMARAMIKDTTDPLMLNNIAYALGDANIELPLAQEYGEKAVKGQEDLLKGLDVNALTNDDLAHTNSLVASWDTLGWIYFRKGDLEQADLYLTASWNLGQNAASADHLGDLYQKQGKHDAAIHQWRLALAADTHIAGVKEKLEEAGQPLASPSGVKSDTSASRAALKSEMTGGEELGKLRTMGLPSLKRTTGSAEFFLVFARTGPTQARFIAGDEAMRDATSQLTAVQLPFSLPDQGPERIVRRGIVSCSKYTTPNCQLVLIPTYSTRLQ